MELKIVLDFDGVLFNSAFEAYSVCNRCTEGDGDYRQEVDFEEFLEFRSFVTDAWQYRRLYAVACQGEPFDELPTVKPGDEDWAFATRFFEAREAMMADADWPKVMSPSAKR